MMFYSNVTMAFTAIGSVLIGFVLVAFIMGFSQPLFKRQQENLANINGYIEEIYTGQAVVTSYNASKESSQAFKGLNDKLYKGKVKNGTISNVNSNKTTDKAVETKEERKIDSLNKVNKKAEGQVKVKKDTETKSHERVKKVDADNRSFPWWILIVLILIAGSIWVIRTKFKKYL